MQRAAGSAFDHVFVLRLRAAHGLIFPAIAAIRSGTHNDVVRRLAQEANQFVMTHLTLLEGTGLVDYGHDVPIPPDPAPLHLDRAGSVQPRTGAGGAPPRTDLGSAGAVRPGRRRGRGPRRTPALTRRRTPEHASAEPTEGRARAPGCSGARHRPEGAPCHRNRRGRVMSPGSRLLIGATVLTVLAGTAVLTRTVASADSIPRGGRDQCQPAPGALPAPASAAPRRARWPLRPPQRPSSPRSRCPPAPAGSSGGARWWTGTGCTTCGVTARHAPDRRRRRADATAGPAVGAASAPTPPRPTPGASATTSGAPSVIRRRPSRPVAAVSTAAAPASSRATPPGGQLDPRRLPRPRREPDPAAGHPRQLLRRSSGSTRTRVSRTATAASPRSSVRSVPRTRTRRC